jgi:hypothetical protein
MLPGELVWALNMIGYTWPAADETELVRMGQAWVDFAGRLDAVVADATSVASGVWAQNEGADIEAFRAWWSREDSPAPALADGVTAAAIAGSGLAICGGIVLALKIAVAVQLTILVIEIAQAIATAAPTFGASLLEIPVFQTLTRTVVENLVSEALLALLDG